MVEITRTLKVKIDLSLAVARATLKAYAQACNIASTAAFEAGCISNRVRLQKLAYENIRQTTSVTAQVAISAIRDVCAAYMTVRTQKKHLDKPIRFKGTSVTLQGGDRGRDFAFHKNGVSLSTSEGRIKGVRFYHAPEGIHFFDGTWAMGTAKLVIQRNNAYLLVTFSKEVPDPKPADSMVGVDRGMNYLAVAATASHSCFFGGGRLKQVRRQYRSRRQTLQKKKAQTPSRSVRRVLQRLSGRESRYVRDVNHVISKRIVQFALLQGSPIIALENLKGIRDSGKRFRKSQRSEFHSWPFFDLENKIAYKAVNAGLATMKVDPRNTSKGCSRCGCFEETSRNRHSFVCHACGYHLHSDLNASRNIRLRGILARQVLGQDGSPSVAPEVPLVDAKARRGIAAEGRDKLSALAVSN